MVTVFSLTAFAVLVVVTAMPPRLARLFQPLGILSRRPVSDPTVRAAGRLLSVNWNGDEGSKKVGGK